MIQRAGAVDSSEKLEGESGYEASAEDRGNTTEGGVGQFIPAEEREDGRNKEQFLQSQERSRKQSTEEEPWGNRARRSCDDGR